MGVNFAKSLAFANHIPLCGVDHVHAHIAAAYLAHPNLVPPFLGVVLSGGHTSFYLVRDYTDFEEVGSTRDDAAGEAFDKIGRVIGLPYPGGARWTRWRIPGTRTPIAWPSPALAGDTLDFSFSGLKTAALNLLHTAEQKGEIVGRADLAASFTKAVTGAIAKKLDAALARFSPAAVVIAGGVSANSHIRAAAARRCGGARRAAVPAAALFMRRQCRYGRGRGVLRLPCGKAGRRGSERVGGIARARRARQGLSTAIARRPRQAQKKNDPKDFIHPILLRTAENVENHVENVGFSSVFPMIFCTSIRLLPKHAAFRTADETKLLNFAPEPSGRF